MTAGTPPRAGPDPWDRVRFEWILDAPQERVWRALTRPEIVADWLGAEGFAAEPGARFTVETGPGRDPACCEILDAEEPNRLRYAWRDPASPSDPHPADGRVTFELDAVGPGRTRLRVLHERRVSAGLGLRRRPSAARRIATARAPVRDRGRLAA